MTKLDWAAVFAGVNILILVILAFRVVGARQKHKVTIGDGGNPSVLQAIRAHANAAEYIPAGIAGLALLAILEPASLLMVQVLGGMLTFGRVAHGIGLSMSTGLSAGRALGMLSTWLALIGIGGVLVWAGLAPML